MSAQYLLVVRVAPFVFAAEENRSWLFEIEPIFVKSFAACFIKQRVAGQYSVAYESGSVINLWAGKSRRIAKHVAGTRQ